eukprot:13134-Heterococcus_DN1.PRE.1
MPGSDRTEPAGRVWLKHFCGTSSEYTHRWTAASHSIVSVSAHGCLVVYSSSGASPSCKQYTVVLTLSTFDKPPFAIAPLTKASVSASLLSSSAAATLPATTQRVLSPSASNSPFNTTLNVEEGCKACSCSIRSWSISVATGDSGSVASSWSSMSASCACARRASSRGTIALCKRCVVTQKARPLLLLQWNPRMLQQCTSNKIKRCRTFIEI